MSKESTAASGDGCASTIFGGNATDVTPAFIGAVQRKENAEGNGSMGPERGNAVGATHESAEPFLFEKKGALPMKAI